MNKTLVKFKHVNDADDSTYISALYTTNPLEVVQLSKETGSIKLNDDYYRYYSCEYAPTDEVGILNVVYIYVEGYDDEYE